MLRGPLRFLADILQPSWLIRVLPGKFDAWEQGTVEKAEELAQHAFPKDEAEELSVFRVRNPIDEARAIAAWQISRDTRPNGAAHVARFLVGDVLGAGLKITRFKGDTGVTNVDKNHLHLKGNAPNYLELTRSVLRRQHDGDDLVRKLHKPRLVKQLQKLLDDDASLTERARAICDRVLKP